MKIFLKILKGVIATIFVGVLGVSLYWLWNNTVSPNYKMMVETGHFLDGIDWVLSLFFLIFIFCLGIYIFCAILDWNSSEEK